MVDHDCGRHSNVSQVVQECEAVLEIWRGIPDAVPNPALASASVSADALYIVHYICSMKHCHHLLNVFALLVDKCCTAAKELTWCVLMCT